MTRCFRRMYLPIESVTEAWAVARGSDLVLAITLLSVRQWIHERGHSRANP
jgi:hypothetical protein